jgi:hypothetical protein
MAWAPDAPASLVVWTPTAGRGASWAGDAKASVVVWSNVIGGSLTASDGTIITTAANDPITLLGVYA